VILARAARAAGLAVGALALGAAALVPARVGDLRLVPVLPEVEPGPPGLVAHVDVRLEERMPQLEGPERRELARTLVLEAELARIDPLLVLGIIEVESAYDPDALSHRGAHGLMQLREPTLRREVERAGIDCPDLTDPALNVRAGIRYLRRLLDAFGLEENALMAYNAGPNRILGYLRGGDGQIPERFRVYPRRVKAEVRRLRRGWEAPRPTPAEAPRHGTVALADLVPSHRAGVASSALPR
jgi:hypothetical protein